MRRASSAVAGDALRTCLPWVPTSPFEMPKAAFAQPVHYRLAAKPGQWRTVPSSLLTDDSGQESPAQFLLFVDAPYIVARNDT